MLDAKDFEPHEGGVYLSLAGRRKFVLQYERRLEREFLNEHTGQRTTLRQQFATTVVSYKTALDEPDLFQPFRLN